MIDMDVSSLTISPAASNGLGHGRVIIVLGLAEEGREEDNVVCALEVSAIISTDFSRP